MKKQQKREIAIVGGGAVGMLMALALARQHFGHLEITLIEKSDLSQMQNDQRSIALSYSSVCILNTLGVWDTIRMYATPIEHVHASDKKALGQVRLHAKDESLPFFGVVIKMSYILSALIKTLETLAQVTLMSGSVVKDIIKQTDNAYQLEVSHDQKVKVLKPDLIIAADGANSFIRKCIGIEPTLYDYQQSAVVFDIDLKRFHQNWAYERFIGDGVMAMLPLRDNKASCIWTMSHDKARAFVAEPKRDQLKIPQETFGYRLGQFCDMSAPKAFPLSLVLAKKLYQGNVLLFGNAAHFLHPVSAQGFNLSIRDVGILHDLFVEDSAIDNDVSRQALLGKYAQLRRIDHKRTAMITHRLMGLFTQEHQLIKQLRSMGLYLLQRDMLAKKLFSHLMMGKLVYGSTLMQQKVL